jgi:hypothetical protein
VRVVDLEAATHLYVHAEERPTDNWHRDAIVTAPSSLRWNRPRPPAMPRSGCLVIDSTPHSRFARPVGGKPRRPGSDLPEPTRAPLLSTGAA